MASTYFDLESDRPLLRGGFEGAACRCGEQVGVKVEQSTLAVANTRAKVIGAEGNTTMPGRSPPTLGSSTCYITLFEGEG